MAGASRLAIRRSVVMHFLLFRCSSATEAAAGRALRSSRQDCHDCRVGECVLITREKLVGGVTAA